ncbi:hypothetical protein BBJ28_00014293 [Nothophytophthora sp. Chile5]|nr:hypothetical protein BBJ28_00014293 [Nothophytophthora sp. Chile5]
MAPEHRGAAAKRAATPSARILQRVREDATDLAVLATTTSHDWKVVSDKNGTKLYEMTGESLSSHVSTVRTFGKGGGGHPSEFYLVRAAASVRADVNTMLDVLRTSNSEDFRGIMKKLFDKQFENGAVVDSLSCTTPPPFAPSPDANRANGGNGWQLFSEDDGYSANWLTLRAFSKLGGLDGHRDFTMVCYQDVFERTNLSDRLERVGRRMARDPQRQQPITGSKLLGVHTFSSMNFQDIPELPKSSKTDRLHFRNSGVVVEELDEDAEGPSVRVSLFLSLMPSKLVLKEVSQSPRMRVAQAAGGEVAKKYRKWLQTLAQGVQLLAQAAKPAVTMQHLSKMTWTESDHCFLCLKTFRTYRRRHHCRFCGEAVCGSCSAFVNMAAFDVNYGQGGGLDEAVALGQHRKLEVRARSDGSASPNTAGVSSEEFMEARGCTTCVSELQMNLTMLAHANRSQQNSSLYSSSSSGSLSQLVNARTKGGDAADGDSRYSNYSGRQGPPPPYPSAQRRREGGSDREDQVMPMRAGDYQQYQQYSGQKMSFSTISSSSYSGLSHDERAQLALYSSTSSAEFMGKAPPHQSARGSSATPSSFSASDASLSAFLARDPDILELNGLTLSPRGSIAPSMMSVMNDDEHMDMMYKRKSSVDHRASYATTAATNEGSNHSQFHFANMTAQEAQQTALLVNEAAARGNVRAGGRPPLTGRHQPQYQPDFEPSPGPPANRKLFSMARVNGGAVSSPVHSVHSSYSSGSGHSDLIHLPSAKAPPPPPTQGDFVFFNDSRQTQVLNRTEGAQDMIPLTF